jgi:MFS family permease
MHAERYLINVLTIPFHAGSLLFNPINAALVTKFGWRVAFRVASGLILMTGIVCCWVFSSKQDVSMQRLEDEDEAPVEAEEVEDEAVSLLFFFECQFHSCLVLLQLAGAKIPRRCCTFSEMKERPEIVLWYIGNGLSYLGFFMPFLNLVSISLRHIHIPPNDLSCKALLHETAQH